MAIRPIVEVPDPRLRQISKPVAAVDADVRALVADMFETMYAAPGIGLAAIQVGVPQRILVIDLQEPASDEEGAPPVRDPRVFINPEIVEQSEELSVHEEGCLSIPEYYEEVKRPSEVTVRYLDLDGNEQKAKATGLFATCIQHEIDHLNGVLFIDYISKLKRDRIVKKFTKAAKRATG